MKIINVIVLILILVGAINWGLVGLFNFDIVAGLFGGATSMFSKLLYILIGLSGLWGLTFFKNIED